MRYVFPGLYKEARTFLLITASSGPCERLLSKAGGTATATRSRLSSKYLDMLLFLGGFPTDLSKRGAVHLLLLSLGAAIAADKD
ncbi:hypothetical protein J6590_073664 [Homalodisca vitripennis]|nr:hypothetical protein J6590_073664 [Homalodisca vitripennis]